MSQQNGLQIGGLWAQFWRRVRLAMRLMGDERVPLHLKGIPLLAVLYVLSPLDLIPALLLGPLFPLGAADDAAATWLLLGMFVNMCPPDVVAEHERDLAAQEHNDAANSSASDASTSSQTSPVIEGEYHIIDDEL